MKRFLQLFLLFSLLVLCAAKAYLYYSEKVYSDIEIEGWFEPITDRYNVKIVYKIDDDFFSPLENPPIPAGPVPGSNVSPILHSVLSNYPEILGKAFSMYPDQVIAKYLKAVYFSGEINEGGLKYGGTYDPFRHIVYLVDSGVKTEDQAVSTFHHEFSSLLLSGHSFYLNPWINLNPLNFKYLFDKSKETLELYKEVSLNGSAEDYAKGFMNSYGQTSFENDFNEYSAMIFTYPAKFEKIMRKYPRVRAKFLVWLEFYQKIDPIFTEDYLFGRT